MRVILGACVALLLTCASAGFCGDTATVPMGNLMPDSDIEYNVIPVFPPGGPQTNWVEVFFGVEDRLEVGFHAVAPAGGPVGVELTAAYEVITETNDRPAVIVGVYNPFGANILGNTQLSPYLMAAYNIRDPRPNPHFSDPIIRGHLGYGWGRHGNQFFGAIQAQVGHRLGLVVANYQGGMLYAADVVVGHSHPIHITPGVLQGAPFLRIGYQTDL